MKVSLKYAMKTWGYYAVLMLISVMFMAGIASGWMQIGFGLVLLVAFLALVFNEGAYNGEKACTLDASVEKQTKEGRKVSDEQRAYGYSIKTAALAFVIAALPFLILSTVNIAVAPLYPEPEEAEVQLTEEEQAAKDDPFYFDYENADQPKEALRTNWVKVVSRLVFMPFVFTYELVSNSVLNMLFFLYSLITPAVSFAGYLCGPHLRKKKLHDIALGKKRKMRNLKVNKDKGPRRPKAEV